ncbi:MAG TPA: cytochrome P450 [Polyangiales bacterium]|nr:cytochrome P450 [Polyangiales bacterium]
MSKAASVGAEAQPKTSLEVRGSARDQNIAVDPAIAAVIRNPAAPEGVPRVVPLPGSMPGEVGLLAMLRAFVGHFYYGIDHAERTHARYGELYRYMWAALPTALLWDADEIQKITRNESCAWSTSMGWDALMFAGLDGTEGNFGSLLSFDFDQHRVARKLLMPAFTSKAMKGYSDIAAPMFEGAVSAWVARGHVDFKREVRSLLAHTSAQIFTGIDDRAHADMLDQALTDFWHGPLAFSRDPRLSPGFRRAQRGFQTLREFFTALVPERRAQPRRDLFSNLCQVDEREGFSDEAMVRIFLTVMFGAFDTTSMATTSMAYLLAKHPEWQERLRAEADPVISGGIDPANLVKLEQCEWFWKETMRIFPVSLGIPRRALREVEVLGTRLPAGAFVVPMTGAVGRHPRWWKEPSRFDPERFSPARAEDRRHPAIYLPFGGGAHACIGMQLANLEAKLLFSMLLTRCRIELAPDYEGRHTLTPLGTVSGKVRLKLTPIG